MLFSLKAIIIPHTGIVNILEGIQKWQHAYQIIGRLISIYGSWASDGWKKTVILLEKISVKIPDLLIKFHKCFNRFIKRAVTILS